MNPSMSEDNTLAYFHHKTFSQGTRPTSMTTKLLKDAYIKGSGVTLATLHRNKHYIKLDQLANTNTTNRNLDPTYKFVIVLQAQAQTYMNNK